MQVVAVDAAIEEASMSDTDVAIIEVDLEGRLVRRQGKEVLFDSEFEWKTFMKLFEAARHGRPCTAGSLAAGTSALLFLSALAWLKSSLEPLDLAVVQFDGPTILRRWSLNRRTRHWRRTRLSCRLSRTG
jgi:hypothetical protein